MKPLDALLDSVTICAAEPAARSALPASTTAVPDATISTAWVLALATLAEVTGQPELAWRLARREAYDALSTLVQATRRALVEPRAVQPPIALLEQLQAHGYQLLGQLSAVQSTLLLRRERLQLDRLAAPLVDAAREIQAQLDLDAPCAAAVPGPASEDADATLFGVPEALPDPRVADSSPWLLRRLALATGLAGVVRGDALAVLDELATASKPSVNRPAPPP